MLQNIFKHLYLFHICKYVSLYIRVYLYICMYVCMYAYIKWDFPSDTQSIQTQVGSELPTPVDAILRDIVEELVNTFPGAEVQPGR